MNNSFKLLSLLAAVLTATANLAVASQDTDADINSERDIDLVVVTATGTPRLLADSPVPITVITKEDIQQSSVTTLDEALVMLSPSFSVHVNSKGTTLTFNGLEEDYYLVLENGERVEGEDPFSRIDLSRVQRVEVLSGAVAALYGANAVGGVINVITTMPDAGLSIQMHTKYNSEDRLTQTANVALQLGRLSSVTSFSRQSAGSWQLSEYEEEGDELVVSDHVASSGYVRENVNQKFEYRVNDKLSLTAKAGYYNYETDRPQSSFYSYSYNLWHEDISYGAGLTYRLSDNSTILANYNGDSYTKYYKYFSASKYGTVLTNKITTYHNLQTRGIFDLYEGNTLSAGFEYTRNGLDDDGVWFSDTYALFAQDEITLARNLLGLVGARVNYQDAFGVHISPNASLMYKVGAFSLRATYAEGLRAPTLEELYAERIESSASISYSNDNLEPETSRYTSVTAEYNSSWLSLSAT